MCKTSITLIYRHTLESILCLLVIWLLYDPVYSFNTLLCAMYHILKPFP